MNNLKNLRKALASGATAAEAAKHAKELAADPANAPMLPELVAILADAVITPPKRGRGGQAKLKAGDPALSEETQRHVVTARTMGNIALSEYAHIVNARNIADGRQPEFAGYGVEMSKDEAIRYLKDRGLFAHGRSGIKSRAKKYAIDKVRRFARITTDDFDRLKREYLSTN